MTQTLSQSERFETTKISTEQLSELPVPVANWLKTSGSVGKEKVNTVCLLAH
jgi:hypothetical protein